MKLAANGIGGERLECGYFANRDKARTAAGPRPSASCALQIPL